MTENGKSPCSDEWNREFERQVKARDDLSAEQRARIDAARQERRERRRAFWRDFPSAFRFQLTGENELRFSPQGASADGMLSAIQGRLWFDASTYEITRLEYELTRDVSEPFLRFPKGTHFAITLARSEDRHYLPATMLVRQPGKNGRSEEKRTSYSEFRRFQADSAMRFVE